jgi:hypothetical protein
MILDFFEDLNWLAVVVATLAAFAVGSVWYAPPVFGRIWAAQVTRWTGRTEEELGEGGAAPALAKWLVGMFVNAVVLALALEAMGGDSIGDGIVAGLVLGLGFGVTVLAWPVIFAGAPTAWWLINTGSFLAMQTVAGAILGGWD